ncbi:MAG: hypothetical protein IKU37_01210 [Candidatus Gastranaerophilales bacterium]|nr:hypothetical protein [Candidatus Gastranaerophilales bacterium]
MKNKQFDYLDIITVMSFAIGLEALELAKSNLMENRQQTDDTQNILNDLQEHLKQQDEILANQDEILYKLNERSK